jgi:hypothetical protein
MDLGDPNPTASEPNFRTSAVKTALLCSQVSRCGRRDEFFSTQREYRFMLAHDVSNLFSPQG